MSFLTENETETTNGMKALVSTTSSLVDLFFGIGAARNNPNIASQFVNTYQAHGIHAMKILFWARDVRGGAGERKVFRDCLNLLQRVDPHAVNRFIPHIPEYGRWDDVLAITAERVVSEKITTISEGLMPISVTLVKSGLSNGDALCAKWMPRKGRVAVALREGLGMSPKEYRKTIASLSKTVEQQMCARKWDDINFSHVPSIASKAYQKAFKKHQATRYEEWQKGLATGETKVNAAAIFPHDVIVGLRNGDIVTAEAQWAALPNYMEGSSGMIPMVDVSGSMSSAKAGGNASCMDIALALGLYISERQQGTFKDEIITFSETPSMIKLVGTLDERRMQLQNCPWGMTTDITSAFNLLLSRTISAGATQEQMPKVLLILSDMQFNQCGNQSGLEMIRARYETAGYTPPTIVFWNLNGAYNNVPATANEQGVMLVSGFSPAIMKSILACDDESLTPEGMMWSVINSPRYAAIQ